MMKSIPMLIVAVAVVAAAELAVESAADNISPQCPVEAATPPDHEAEGTCSLYLAKSSVSEAGVGLYTAEDVPLGFDVGLPDELFVPIADKLKTLPYRGQQRFLSWLGYVWPEKPDAFYHSWTEEPYPAIPEPMYEVDEGLNAATGVRFVDDKNKPISAFAPGVASLVNSLPPRANIQKRDDAELKDDDDSEAAYTSHHGVVFAATKDISAGSELYLNYGDEWHSRYNSKYGEDRQTDFRSMEEWIEEVQDKIPTEQEKRNRLQIETARLEQKRRMKEQAVLNSEQKNENNVAAEPKQDETETLQGDTQEEEVTNREMKEKSNGKDDEQHNLEEKRRAAIAAIKDSRTEDETLHVESRLRWLKKNGACVDNLRTGPSTVEGAGRGAFAKRFIGEGSLISPAPLLALKRDDLNIYYADMTQNSYRDTLDLEKVVGQELLLNYCYGHPDSPLLLLPYAPMVNYINHDGMEPNAEIQWPEETFLNLDPEDWLDSHPLDVLDMSGELIMEFVALRDIRPGEEVLINYGRSWENAWRKHLADRVFARANKDAIVGAFRHEIGVPEDFFPENWLHQKAVYELAPLEAPLKPGEVAELTWAHNGEPIMMQGYRVGLPSGFSAHMLEYADRMGFISLYEKLLHENTLDSDDWYVFDTHGEQWFAQRYKSTAWNFNIHYVAAWDETARVSLLREMGKAGFNAALEGIGEYFELDSLTCFHASFMGVTECDNSVTHADVYATEEKAFNIIFPLMVVNGSKPELDIISENANVIIPVHYEYDTALVMGDWGYHKTSSIDYREAGRMRIVMGTYCGQIDDDNRKMIEYIYDGEDPAPFMDQFSKQEIHWGDGYSLPK